MRPSFLHIIAIALIGILIALLLLPGIAGLIEGDFGYLRYQIDRGWNNSDQSAMTQVITDIYAWSFYRFGWRDQIPMSYNLHKFNELNKRAQMMPLED